MSSPSTSAESRLRFNLALQNSRLAVHTLAFGLAVAAKVAGVLHVDWVPGLSLYVLAGGSAVLCRELYRRGADRRFDVGLLWMGLDIFIPTAGVYLTGGMESPWFIWYLANTGAAAFATGAPVAALIAALNTGAYVGLLAGMGQITDLSSFLLPLSRMGFLYGAAFFFLRGVARLQESQRALKQLRQDESLKMEELIRLTQDLDQGTRALAEANVQIREADRVKSQFLANMSHELRTPLNSIIGFSEVLLERMGDEVNPRYRKFLANIHDSGEHLLRIINDILDLSKVEAGRMELHPEEVHVRALVEDVLGLIQATATPRRLRLEADLPPGLPPLRADPSKFKQVLLNLVSNAVKFSPDGALVRVEVRAEPAGAVLEGPALAVHVVDQGIGVAAADQEIIFEEFRQADGSASRAYGGTGLGLALVRKFVEFQGGKVWLKSAPGVGSTFSFALPLDATAPAPARVDTAPQLPGATRVLVVEDDLDHYQALSRSLAEAGYFPIRARLGEEALEMARMLKPAALTLDIVLPDMSGWDVLRAVKRDPATRHIPVVIVSMADNRELGLTLGAEDYFTKPVDRATLLTRLSEIAPLSGALASRILLVDDDPDVHDLLGDELARQGYVVDHARSGREGLALARGQRPDAVVLDLMMPDLSGFEVADALQEDPRTARVPIVVLTAKDLTREERLLLQGKIAALVQKGQAIPPRLVAAIRELQSRHAREGGHGV